MPTVRPVSTSRRSRSSARSPRRPQAKARSCSSSPRRSFPPTHRPCGRRRSPGGRTRARRRRSRSSTVERSRCRATRSAGSARSPASTPAEHHRKLVPTNHERLIWGQGDGRGLRAFETRLGRLGGLICWENYMPLARFSLYESGVEIYIASTADDSDAWQATLVHIARESRAFVIAPSHFQRSASYPDDFPLLSELDAYEIIGRGGSAILGPDGSYLAGPAYDDEAILYADLDPQRLYE